MVHNDSTNICSMYDHIWSRVIYLRTIVLIMYLRDDGTHIMQITRHFPKLQYSKYNYECKMLLGEGAGGLLDYGLKERLYTTWPTQVGHWCCFIKL